ncbi:hypothetical protein GCM10010492_16320 [Saccharothrix mutabilis subsp. mutabilis]|uniref:Uncharacterized protein n=1 Tax=Saccharothrix mutabilis subsp. mutabilis TaxID=66855 RepID=A0ABN0TDU1_9PSEU
MPTRVWVGVSVAVVALVAAVLVGVRLSESELIPVDVVSGEVTIVGSLAVEPAEPLLGNTVVVKATISADRAVTLAKVVVRVKDDKGTARDFPALEDVRLDTTPRTVEAQRRFASRGTFTYYLAYERDGAWVSLPPWRQFTVR